jgi:hypothetical protein
MPTGFLLGRRLAVDPVDPVGIGGVAAVVVVLWLLLTHLCIAFGVLALIAAVAVGVANLRTLARR